MSRRKSVLIVTVPEPTLRIALIRVIAEAGYRGHKTLQIKGLRIYMSGEKRGATDQIERELRRRAAVEPVIGHLKEETHGWAGRALVCPIAGPPP